MAVKYNKTGEYTRALANFGGVDFSSDDSTVSESRFPYAVNMWRDWESENGAAVETFPGYRKIARTYDSSTAKAKIYGLWRAKFTVNGITDDYIIIHRGVKIFVSKHADRDISKALTSLGTIGEGKACGFSFGENFYLILNGKLWRISSPTKMTEVSGENAYIPTTYSDGKEYEQRNMLTNYFYNAYNVTSPEEVSYYNGLKLRVISDTEKTLAVTGTFSGITHLYIPSETVWNGEVYKITAIDPGAFTGNGYIQSVVIASGVKQIGTGAVVGANQGAFYSCNKLETVVIHGAEGIGAECFSVCHALKRVVLPNTLKSVGSYAFNAQPTGNTYYYYAGTDAEATALSLASYLPEKAQLTTGTSLIETTVGATFQIPVDLTMYTKYSILKNKVSGAISYVGEYNISDEESKESGAEFKALAKASWIGIAFADESESTTKLAVVTISENGNAVSPQESTLTSYRFDILDPCEQVLDVTLDDKSVSSERNGAEVPIYYNLTETLDGKKYIRAVILTADSDTLVGKKLVIKGKAYESEFSRTDAGSDYTYDNPSYTGTSSAAIKNCTLCAEFDGRIFLTGNPNLPNTVFYSHRNLTGVNDPTYFGQLNYFNDGTGMVPNKSILSTPSFLAVIKEDDIGGAIYYHTASETEYDVLPKIYPGVQGAAGVGSLGPCANFRDDPVFLSKMGLEGISLSTVNLERGLYHRSSNVDQRLLANKELKNANMCEWKGYLVILVGRDIYLADSRQTFNHVSGSWQYEWYYLTDIGEYDGQVAQYFFPSSSPKDSLGRNYTDMYYEGIRFEVKKKESLFEGTIQDGRIKIAEPSLDPEGTIGTADGNARVYYTEEVDELGNTHYYILVASNEYVGGDFMLPTAICEVKDVLYFGTERGNIFCFNTDKRGEAYSFGSYTENVPSDRIHRNWYTFNGRRYLSGFATKKDNCGVPQYDKDTIPRSLILKNKSITGSRFLLKVRTDRETWEEVEMITGTEFASDATDFSNMSYVTSEEMIYPCREKKRRWVEKQYYLYSDGFRQPFGVYYLVYRYKLSGLAGRIRRN